MVNLVSGTYPSGQEMEPHKPSLRDLMKNERLRVARATRDGEINVADMPRPLNAGVAEEDLPTDDEYLLHLATFADALQAAYIPTEDELPRYFNINFPKGYRFCLAGLGFADGFASLEDMKKEGDGAVEDFLNRSMFLKWLAIDPDTGLTYNFGDKTAYYGDLLPPILNRDISEGGCSFALDYPFPEGDPRNKGWFLGHVQTALDNLKNMI